MIIDILARLCMRKVSVEKNVVPVVDVRSLSLRKIPYYSIVDFIIINLLMYVRR